jgi:dCMP deaminase
MAADLIVDQEFRNAFKIHLKDLSEIDRYEKINELFSKYDPEMVLDAVNIIKTAITLDMTYKESHDKVVEEILRRFPHEDDIELFILVITMKILIAMGTGSVDSLLQKPRDIYKEITAESFRVPLSSVTEEMIDTVKKKAQEFEEASYSVTEPRTETWDDYFYNMARQTARNSKCLSRSIGCVMVRDKSIMSTGYNGPPRGIPRCDLRWKLDQKFSEEYGDKVIGKKLNGVCPRYAIGFKSGQGLEICTAGHAERNALINAARNGIKTKNTTLYMSCGIPCSPCLIEIINAGVKEIVCTSLKIYDSTTMYLLTHSALKVRLFDFIK